MGDLHRLMSVQEVLNKPDTHPGGTGRGGRDLEQVPRATPTLASSPTLGQS